MGMYVDLSSCIDVEPKVKDVLCLIDDNDLTEEINNRVDYDFWITFIDGYCGKNELKDLKKALDYLTKIYEE